MNINPPFPILRIGVDISDTCRFLRATHGELHRGWSRRCDYPASYAPNTFYASYLRDRGADECIVHLHLPRTDPDTLTVVSVLPGTGTLTVSQHRALLDDFRSSVLDLPETRAFPVVMVEPPSPRPSGPMPPPEVLKVLKRWTRLFNNGAGFHPFDCFAWHYLIVGLHTTKRCIDFQWLNDWFRLKHLLPRDALTRLEEDLFSSLRLLGYYDEGLDYKRQVELKRSSTGQIRPSTLN